MGILLKITLYSGLGNCLGEVRRFYEIYRNYGKSGFLEVLQVLIQLLNIVTFRFQINFFTLLGD